MRPFAIRPVSRPASIQAVCLLLLLLASARAQESGCGPSPNVRTQLEKITVTLADASDFDRALAPLAALRQKYPGNLWVNERYQDEVQRYGIEGHLRKLTEEYQVLSMQHSDQLTFSYLYARSLIGRNTPAAVEQLTALINDHPGFAPAHGSLAEIYASTAFHDAQKAEAERQRFLALCPGSGIQTRPAALPAPSPLIGQADLLLANHLSANHDDPDRVAAMAMQGIREDEWRLQRIRPFDWYSVDYKRQAQRDLQAAYWRVWTIHVRCDRLAGQPAKADELLATMEQRVTALRIASDPMVWDALATLAHLYQEGNQKDSATQKLNSMQEFLAAHPDPGRSAQLEQIRKSVEQ